MAIVDRKSIQMEANEITKHTVALPDRIATTVSNPDRIGTKEQRKATPLFSGFINYFPDAVLAVAELSRIGGEQHNPGKSLHWDRSKSGDELDALARHLVDAGSIDDDGVRHSAKVAWRALANLQKEIETSKQYDEMIEAEEMILSKDEVDRRMGRYAARYETDQEEAKDNWDRRQQRSPTKD